MSSQNVQRRLRRGSAMIQDRRPTCVLLALTPTRKEIVCRLHHATTQLTPPPPRTQVSLRLLSPLLCHRDYPASLTGKKSSARTRTRPTASTSMQHFATYPGTQPHANTTPQRPPLTLLSSFPTPRHSPPRLSPSAKADSKRNKNTDHVLLST